MKPSFEKTGLEILTDSVLRYSISEMAIASRKAILRKVDDFEDIITLHLIKILAFQDHRNLKKHLKDINTWLQEIQKFDFKKKGNKLSQGDYFKKLFIEPFTDSSNEKYVTQTIRRRLREYHSLERTSMTDLEIVQTIEKIYRLTSSLISQDSLESFEADVWERLL